ncbi:hypothetical protein DV736_g696, partial [Chaetothyriales sp. CBS 134916]
MPPVGPRAPKDEFMRALSLDPSNPHHEGHYRAMRDEAIAAYNRLNTDRSNLIEERRNDPATQQPFFWHHIRPEVRRRAIIETWQNARAGSVQRRLFDSGATVGEHAPNWVTLWLLYSVFRSRDVRNNRTRRNENGGGSAGGGGGCGGKDGGGESLIYDPARNIYRSI